MVCFIEKPIWKIPYSSIIIGVNDGAHNTRFILACFATLPAETNSNVGSFPFRINERMISEKFEIFVFQGIFSAIILYLERCDTCFKGSPQRSITVCMLLYNDDCDKAFRHVDSRNKCHIERYMVSRSSF